MARNRYSLISTKQLADICGVSQGTVDRALHGRSEISCATRDKILSAAKKYGYCPNLPKGTAPSGKSMLWGVVLFDLDNEYFSRFVMDFERLCQRTSYSSVVMFSHKDAQDEIGCINQLVHLGADGIVLCPIGEGEEYVKYLKSLRTPIVTVGNRLPDIPYVGIDDKSAMEQLCLAALSDGYGEFIYYAPLLAYDKAANRSAQELRYQGFTDTMARHEISFKLITDECELTAALTHSENAAVICPSDSYALAAYGVMRDIGRPGNGIYSFDNTRLLDSARIPIDSVDCERGQLIEALHKILDGKAEESVFIKHIIVRRCKSSNN